MPDKPGSPDPPPRPNAPRPDGSQPDILVSYKPAGRETLEAITGELLPLPLSDRPHTPSRPPATAAPARESSSPEITVHETLLAREGSSPEITVHRALVPRESSSPEITVREGAIERDTLAAIMEEARGGDLPAASEQAEPSGLEIFELATYVIRGGDVARLASEALRRAFVEQHLLARLPVKSMRDVDRVDVTPWTVQGTLVVRVWCKTAPGSRGG